MKATITFLDVPGPADVEITLSGAPTPETFAELNTRLMNDPRFRRGITMLVDLSELDVSELPESAVQSLSDTTAERDWYRTPSAVAIVAPTEAIYDAARVYRAHLGGSKSNRHLFGDRAEAAAWLAHSSGTA